MSALNITRKAPEGAAGQQVEQRSLRERLRARREALAAASTRDFDVPGYGGELVARYRRLTFEELRKALPMGSPDEIDLVAVNAQFLVDACDELLTREPDGTLAPLIEGAKTTYTVNLETSSSLGTILGVDHLPSIREQLVAALGGNELALDVHSGEVHRWMIDMNDLDGEMALGESAAR